MFTRDAGKKLVMIIILLVILVGCSGAGPAATPESVSSAGESPQNVEPTLMPEPTAILPTTPLLLYNGLIVTATGDDPISNGAILIEDGLITAVGDDSTFTIPENAVKIDVDGQTILPGIIEGRASLLLNVLDVDDEGIDNVNLSVFLRIPLTKGVTTIRSAGWEPEKRVYGPDLPGIFQSHGNTIPTVLFTGPTIAHSEGSGVNKYYPQSMIGIGSAEEARQMTEELIQLGVYQVNIGMSTGPEMDEEPEERGPVLSQEQVEAIVETAHSHDIQVIAQGLFSGEVMTLINGGVDQLISWPTLRETMPDDLLEALVSDSVPVLSGFSVGMPPEGDVRRFLDSGGILVYGTFAPNSGSNPRREFGLMELNGMTPMEMIMSATANAANAVGLGEVTGTLEVGKQADILVVGGNLFEDDFSSTIDKVVYVVKNGDLVVLNGELSNDEP